MPAGHMAEYTTFRKDSYRGGHQPSAVSFADTVEEDSLRRDFLCECALCAGGSAYAGH